MSALYLIILLSVSARFLSILIITLYVLPKQWEQIRLNSENKLKLVARGMFIGTILYLVEIIFPLMLGVGFLRNPIEVNNMAFLFAFTIASFGDLTTSILLWILYNKKPKKLYE